MNLHYLKFRVWNETTKNFVQFRPASDPEPFVYNLLDPIDQNHIQKGMGTPEQCVGHPDKKGQLAFVGDIIICPWLRKEFQLCVIKWNCRYCRFSAESVKNPGNWWLWQEEMEQVKILGNIHENPELLNIK